MVGAEGDEGGAVAVGLFGADAGDLEQLGEAARCGEGDVFEAGVGEDQEGRFAGLGGLGFAPVAETGFELLLRGSEARGFALGRGLRE